MSMHDVELRSGKWRANPVRVSTPGPEPRADAVVYVYLRQGESSSMELRAIAGADFHPDQLPALARRPGRRTITCGGDTWELHPVERPDGIVLAIPPDPNEVVFTSRRGRFGRGALPDGVLLGDATDLELDELIEIHRQD